MDPESSKSFEQDKKIPNNKANGRPYILEINPSKTSRYGQPSKKDIPLKTQPSTPTFSIGSTGKTRNNRKKSSSVSWPVIISLIAVITLLPGAYFLSKKSKPDIAETPITTDSKQGASEIIELKSAIADPIFTEIKEMTPDPDESKSVIEESVTAKPRQDLPELTENNTIPSIEKSIVNQLGQKKAEDIFVNYINANEISDFSSDIYQFDALREVIEKEWQSIKAPSSWPKSTVFEWFVSESENVIYGILKGELPNYEPFQAYFREENGEMKLDWSATTAYSSASIEDLNSDSADTSELRVLISRDSYYSTHYPDDEYLSYKVISANKEHVIWAFAKRGSSTVERLANKLLFLKDGDSQRVTIQVKRSNPDAPKNQWLIDKVINLSWLDR